PIPPPPISTLFPYTTLFRSKWPDKSDHEINGVIGGQDAQVADSWRKWIPGNQRFALLQIIFVSKNASLGVPTRPGGVNNACRILDRKSTRLNSSHRTISYAV